MEFNRAIDFIRRDPEWMTKLLFAGLHLLVPIAGVLSMLGWQRRIFDGARVGQDELPKPDFVEDLKLGIDPFIAALNVAIVFVPLAMLLFGVPMAMTMAAGAIGGDAGQVVGAVGGLLSMVSMLIWFVLILGINVLMPELIRRGMRGERFPLFSPGASFAAIRSNAMPYVMLIVGGFVANFVGGIGIWLCCVGVFITQPAAMAAMGNLMGQWDQKVG